MPDAVDLGFLLCGALSASAATWSAAPFVASHERKYLLMKAKRLAFDAMLIAMYFVFSNYLAINLGSIRLTLDSLPIIIGACLFGPVDGLIIGLIGNFLFQLAGPYGVSATTVLWCLPDALRGLLAGLLLKNAVSAPSARLWLMLGLISLAATTLTTGVMYIDCLVYKYAFSVYTPFILWRYIVGLAVAVLIALMLPALIKALRQTLIKPEGDKT